LDGGSVVRKASTYTQNNTKHRINAHNTNIHALSGIRTHDPASQRAKTVHALDCAANVVGEAVHSTFMNKDNGNLRISETSPRTIGSTALVNLGRFFSFLMYTQSVGLLERGISPSQSRYRHTEQHRHSINAHRHPCLELNSNPRPQCSRELRRFMP
jgi:hypothetical protein